MFRTEICWSPFVLILMLTVACSSSIEPTGVIQDIVAAPDSSVTDTPRSGDLALLEDATGQLDAGDSSGDVAGDLDVQSLEAGDLLHDTDSTCIPDCVGKLCGDDGCGGSCGDCKPSSKPCMESVCVQGQCLFAPMDGDCDDDNVCTLGDFCEAGDCQAGLESLDCDDDNVCTDDTCNPKAGCGYFPNFDVCDDGNACTEGDVCWASECNSGQYIDCDDDNNPCTDDNCDIEEGCGHSNLLAGTECGDWMFCNGSGECLPCDPDCDGKECGANNCGGSCGDCPENYVCLLNQTCMCTPNCQGQECGDDTCGGTCGTCPEIAPVCEDGKCVMVCEPNCGDKECGPDGCGGGCGSCPEQHVCLEDQTCLCIPDCGDKECGSNGCGGLCGICPGSQDSCVDSQCKCVPDCEAKECGLNGCGGMCGWCAAMEACTIAGECVCYTIVCNEVCCPLGEACDAYGECCTPVPEVCGDVIDNDCDGQVNEEDAGGCQIYYMDFDGDGAGADESSKCICSPSPDYQVMVGGDCCDSDNGVFPGSTKYQQKQTKCGGFDFDCDGKETTKYNFPICSQVPFEHVQMGCWVAAEIPPCGMTVSFCLNYKGGTGCQGQTISQPQQCK